MLTLNNWKLLLYFGLSKDRNVIYDWPPGFLLRLSADSKMYLSFCHNNELVFTIFISPGNGA